MQIRNHQIPFINIRNNPMFKDIDIRTNENIYEIKFIHTLLFALFIIIISYLAGVIYKDWSGG